MIMNERLGRMHSSSALWPRLPGAVFWMASLAIVSGCGDDGGDSYGSPDDQADGTETDDGDTMDDDSGPIAGYPELDAACRFPVAEPSRFAVSASDDNTGSIGLVDVADRRVQPDLALAQTDIALDVHGDRLYAINRLGFDYVDVLDLNDDLALLAEFAVSVDEERSANPHTLVVDEHGHGYLSVFGGDAVQVFDVSDVDDIALLDTVELAPFADDDGLPEMGMMVACGNVGFVAIERLDQNQGWAPVDHSYLVPFEMDTNATFDFDDTHQGPDAIELLGVGPKNFRADPSDPAGHTLLLLTSGLERIDLASGSSEWVIDAEVFEAQGFGRYQLRDFDVGADGWLYFSLANADFTEHMIYRGSLDGGGEDLELVIGGLDTVTGDLEVVGSDVWFSDTTVGASGLRVFDVATQPAQEIEGSPFATGLPPYGLLPLE